MHTQGDCENSHKCILVIVTMWFEIALTVVVLFLSFVLYKSKRQNETCLNVKGKYVLITGCDSGFGRATAIQLYKMGVRVLATCLTKEGEQSLKSATSDKLTTFQMDVRDSRQIREVCGKVKELLDGEGKAVSFVKPCFTFLH